MTLVETIVAPSTLVAVGTAMVTFATLITLASPYLKSSSLETRLKAVSSRREELRRKSREALASKGAAASNLRQTDEGLYKKVVERLQLSRLLEDPQVAEKLATAGFRGPRPITTFYFFRFILPFVFAASTAFYLFLINGFGLPLMSKLVCAMTAMVIGYYAPNIYISNIAQKRRESIVGAFPDALDLLLICVESGMSIEAAFKRVSGEIGSQSIALAEELTLTTAELSYLQDRKTAYENLAKRTDLDGVKSVCMALQQAEKYGTPLAQTLRVMSQENRDMRMSDAEKKAAGLPPKLTVPMILFFLPVLFVVILGPAAIRVMSTQEATTSAPVVKGK